MSMPCEDICPGTKKVKNSPREICPRASVRTRCRDILKSSLEIPQITNRLSTSKVPQTLNQGSGPTLSRDANLHWSRPPTHWSLSLLFLLSVLLWESRSAPSRAEMLVRSRCGTGGCLPSHRCLPSTNSPPDGDPSSGARYRPVPGQSTIMGGTKFAIVVKIDWLADTEMKWSFGWKMKLSLLSQLTWHQIWQYNVM